MTDKEKISEEVKMVVNRRLNLLNGDYFDLNEETDGFTNEIMDIIDSLQEEPVSKDLEEAAKNVGQKYFPNEYNIWARPNYEAVKAECAFKAGAKWQKDKMVQNTIDAHCFGFQGAALFSFRLPADNYLVGSEVKVIVIKED